MNVAAINYKICKANSDNSNNDSNNDSNSSLLFVAADRGSLCDDVRLVVEWSVTESIVVVITVDAVAVVTLARAVVAA